MIKPFIDAANDVFSVMFDIELNEYKSFNTDTFITDKSYVCAKINIIGDLNGSMIYCFKTETILEFVNIMSGMEFTEVDDFVTSALGEIANIISGNALITFSESQTNCDIEPPIIINEVEETFKGNISIINASSKAGDIEFILVS